MSHIIAKAWPMRCSVRNFSDIIRTYVREDRAVHDALLRILYATTTGIYANATPAPLRVHKLMYRYFIYTPIRASELADWAEVPAHAGLLFVSIKEYISHMVALVPSLRASLVRVYPWNIFEEGVQRIAEDVRRRLYMYTGALSDIFSVLPSFSARSFRCGTSPHHWGKTTCNAISCIRGYLDTLALPRDVKVECDRLEVYHRLVAGSSLDDVTTHVMDPARDLVRLLTLDARRMSRADIVTKSKLCSPSDVLAAYEILHGLVLYSSIGINPLPAFIRDMQRTACRRAGRAQHIFICGSCKHLRAFVMGEGDGQGTQRACGHSKVRHGHW